MKNTALTPIDTKKVSLFGSEWENSETETIARNILFIQREMNPDEWSPFTWDDYKSHCKHDISDAEKKILDTLVEGGKPVFDTTATLDSGYLKKDEEHYVITEKFIKVIKKDLGMD